MNPHQRAHAGKVITDAECARKFGVEVAKTQIEIDKSKGDDPQTGQ